ncbi:YeeE/YedE family protein [bacterium]|nr:YeeE/YedE family protein [bacterium]
MGFLGLERWSPYVVGAGIGVLSWFAFLLSDKAIGCSTAFARTSGMLERLFRRAKVMEKPYYQKFVPEVDWEWMLVVGVIVGAFVSAQLSGTFHLQWLPDKWVSAFGATPITRFIVALVGGIFMGFGSRWAGGCTSGHGISGTLQLTLSSWIAAICFFIAGIGAAMLIFQVFAV